MSEFIYPSIDRVIDIYNSTIDISGGGSKGILHKDKIEMILYFLESEYYPKIEDKITYLFYSINVNHCFIDGNKRVALALCVDFFNINGYLYLLNTFLREMENYSLHVAAGNINRDLLLQIVTSIIYEDEFSEELKLEIIDCIS